MSRFDDVTSDDIERLVALFSQNEEFTVFIAEDAVNPFRTTSYMKKVNILDDIFRSKLGNTPIMEITLDNFVSNGDRTILHQLPNLLKTYVIRTDYEFGDNETVDDNFCYVVYRIIETGRVFKSFQTFENAFLKASSLRYNYKQFVKKMEDLFDPEEELEAEKELERYEHEGEL